MAVFRRVAVLAALLLLPSFVSAQAVTQLTLETVLKRGASLLAPLPQVLWLPGGHDATVIVTADDGNQTLHRLADGKLADEVLLAAADVQKALGEEIAGPARFPAMSWVDATTLRCELDHRVARWTLGAERATDVLTWVDDENDAAAASAIAPGDLHVAYLRHHQLWLAAADGRVRQLTFDGSPDIVYGGAAHRAEFGITGGLFWSADGRFLAFYREDQRPIAPYPYQDLDQVPTAPVHGRYPMAGRVHSKVQVGVCDTRDFAVRWLEHDDDADVYWTNVTFGPGDSVCVALVNRGQDHAQLVRFDARTGKRLQVLVDENDPEWVEPEHGPTFLPDGRFLWWSARDGYRHLWLCAADGSVVRQVTKGAFDVQRLLGLAADGKTVWFEASGEDPRQCHLFAASVDRDEVRQLTHERGTHHGELSPDQAWASATWSNLETRPSARLLDLQTGAVVPLPTPTDPLRAFALPTQRLFQVKGENDTLLYGHLSLPPDLKEGQRCPVLLYVYGGPHAQLVTDQWLGGRALWLQALAAEGYVVCSLDNRGTPNRGVDFEQAIHRRLGTPEVQDQLCAIDWLTQQPFVDAARIGVHGWSYGGYLTLRLLLLAPKRFACGISGAPVTDWAMYETGYGERYMDTPLENAQGYLGASCLPLADQLATPLLLVHGTDDRTVMWSHSLAFVDRCIELGRPLRYFPYPMQQHGLVGRDRVYFLRQLHTFLAEHLHPEHRPMAPKPPEPPKPDDAKPDAPPK